MEGCCKNIIGEKKAIYFFHSTLNQPHQLTNSLLAKMKAFELEKKLGRSKHKTTSELKQLILTRSDRNPNFCLFLGAGASRSSQIRTAGEMVRAWRAEVFRDLSNSPTEPTEDEMTSWLSANADWYDPKHEYASLIERRYPLPTNRRKFIETEVSGKIPSIGYAYLVRIAEAGHIQTIFTTNFDDLLTEAFYQFSTKRPIVCAHDSSVGTISITSDRAKIIKLHGDFLFDNLKNTGKETQILDVNMRDKLEEFLKEYGLIVAGYSGSDESIARHLKDMLDDPLYLQNGLYWCFRANDEISDEAIAILGRSRSFYVLTQGFDELMADLYSILSTDASPFNSKLASDRASSVIESYLQNEQLKSSNSPTIKRHLEALESDKSASLLADMMRDLNSESIASAGLSDQNLLVCLEIERALRDRNPETALARAVEELSNTTDRKFKEILLRRRFACAMRLQRLSEARQTIAELLPLEPDNYYISLSEVSLLDSRNEKILYLQNLKDQKPFSSRVLNRYADEVREAIERREKVTVALRLDDVYSALKRSIELNPLLTNSAWAELFDLYAKQSNAATKNKDLLADIVDRHILQDAYASETCNILLKYCQRMKTTEFRGKPLFSYLEEAYSRHFPHEYAAHIAIFVEACIEFDGHRFLRRVLESARACL